MVCACAVSADENMLPHGTRGVNLLQGANLLVTSKGRIKLADFGASRKIEELASCGECLGAVSRPQQ